MRAGGRASLLALRWGRAAVARSSPSSCCARSRLLTSLQAGGAAPLHPALSAPQQQQLATTSKLGMVTSSSLKPVPEDAAKADASPLGTPLGTHQVRAGAARGSITSLGTRAPRRHTGAKEEEEGRSAGTEGRPPRAQWRARSLPARRLPRRSTKLSRRGRRWASACPAAAARRRTTAWPSRSCCARPAGGTGARCPPSPSSGARSG